MKKIYAFAVVMALSTAATITTFAEEALPISSQPQEIVAEMEQSESLYTTMSGTIKSIEKDDKNSYRILVSKDGAEDNDVVFAVEESAFIVNSENGSFMTFDELKADMKITAIVAKNAPMTMSLPPITNPIGFVAGEKNFVTTGYFNEEWVSEDNLPKLQLNISEETSIVHISGARKLFTQDDVKNQDCLVLYGATTRSIPAQTTPVFVMILSDMNQEEQIEQLEQTKKPGIEQSEQTEIVAFTPEKPYSVPLRETAEKQGYTVTWSGNDKPVILQKEDVTIEITVGKSEYKIGDEILQSTETAKLVDSKIYIGSDVIK